HDVEEFVNSNFPKASEDEKTRFSTTLVEEFDAVLGTLNAHTDEPQLRDALRTLKKLQEHLVFLPVDKTSHDFGFICKEKYKELLRDELQQSSTYQEVGESIDDVLERHRDFNKSHKFVHADNLPYLYGIPKLHKPEPRMRYIAGVSEKGNVEKKDEQKDRDEKGRDKKRMKTRASTTPAHQEASGLLKLVLATLRSKDEATFLQTGIRRFFVVESVDDVAVHIKTNYARLRKKAPRTFDFKEMYTKIPQKQIVDYVMSAVAEAFEYMKSEKGANVEAQRAKHRFEFGKPDESNTTSYNVEEIRALVSFIVGNTFVTNGGTCYQQVSGIPMGGNASPDLANLYCYWCEKQYIDGLVAKGLQEEARNHADSVRFIDDFLTWGVRPPPEDIYGMEYGETSKGVDDVVFLGMRIRMERNDKTDFIRMSVLDKGEEFPWNPIKYTHVESTVPRNTGTSIFKGALIRAARICNNMPDLKVEVMKVYYRLRNRGFSGRELRRTFDTFVAQTYGKYELDARVLSRFHHFVGKAYDEGRPTNEEKPYISIRTPQPPDGSPKHPPGRTSPQSTSPHKSEPTSTTHPATKPTNPPGRNGITNIRNSCFFAASVQFLARRTSFRLQLANLTHLDTNQQMVQRLFTDFDAGQNIHGTMATLRSLVFNTTADDSAHRDVHELLTWIRSCVTGDDDDQATGSDFIVGTEEGRIRRCSTAYNSHDAESFEGHYMSVYSVQWNRYHESVFLSASADWTVKLWEKNSKKPLTSFDLGSAVGEAAWAPFSSTVFAAVTADGHVHVYDLYKNKHEPMCDQLVVKKAKLTRISFNSKEPIILVGDDRGTVSSLKLSPNLRGLPEKEEPTVGKKGKEERTQASILEHEIGKLNRIIEVVRKDRELLNRP
ncbi:Dynein intermediate chain 2, partial [Diplonema papillatum]